VSSTSSSEFRHQPSFGNPGATLLTSPSSIFLKSSPRQRCKWGAGRAPTKQDASIDQSKVVADRVTKELSELAEKDGEGAAEAFVRGFEDFQGESCVATALIPSPRPQRRAEDREVVADRVTKELSELAEKDGEGAAEAFVRGFEDFQGESCVDTALIPSPRPQRWAEDFDTDGEEESEDSDRSHRAPWELCFVGTRVIGSVVEVSPRRGARVDLGVNLPEGWLLDPRAGASLLRVGGSKLYEWEVVEVRWPEFRGKPNVVLRRISRM